MESAAMDALAPAKVNLSLRLTGRRSDGYHLLDSITVFTDFGDRISVVPADGLALRVQGDFADSIPTDRSNLVLQAAETLAERAGITMGADITLTKSLPAAGGIGGGSSDAATTMHLLCRLWNLSLTPEDLRAIGLDLGADLPVCLHGAPCRMRGIGEDLSSIPALPDVGILLVNPGLPCETPAVFKARSGGFSVGELPFSPGETAESLASALSGHTNDLTEAAIRVCPSIQEVLEVLTRCDAALMSRMSGSGATCFALFETKEAARSALPTVMRTGWWAAAGGLLP